MTLTEGSEYRSVHGIRRSHSIRGQLSSTANDSGVPSSAAQDASEYKANTDDAPRGRFLILALCSAIVLTVSYGMSDKEFWAWPLGLAVYFGWGAALPKLRPSLTRLEPLAWASWIGLLQLLAVPFILMQTGPFQNVLPYLPEWRVVNAAYIVCCVAFSALALGSGLPIRCRRRSCPNVPRAGWQLIALLLACAYAGALLRLLQHGGITPGSLLNDEAGSSLAGVLGTFLPPLGPLAGVLWWRSAHLSLWSFPVIAFIGLAPVAVYEFNRGAVLYPLVAWGAVVALRRPRGALVLAMIGGLAVLTALAVGDFRTKVQLGALGIEYSARPNPSALEQVQVYAAAPQFVGFAIESDPKYSTLFSSTLYPVPVLGRDFRATSGVQAYAQAVYGDAGATDQILPANAEVYWQFGLAGVVVFFLSVGLALKRLQLLSEGTRDPVRHYFHNYLALILSFSLIWSVSVCVQLLLYGWLVPYIVARVTRAT